MSLKKKAAPAEAAEPPLSLPRFSSAWRLFLYPLCVLQPAAGFTLAALFMGQQDLGARRFGRICLVLSILGACLGAYRSHDQGGFAAGESLVQPFC